MTENPWTQPQPSSTPTPAAWAPVAAPPPVVDFSAQRAPRRPRAKVAMAAGLTAAGVAGGLLIGVGASSSTVVTGSASPAPSKTLGQGDGTWPFGPGSSSGSTGGSTGGSSSGTATG